MTEVVPAGLRFAPSILSRLGEELVPHLEQAVVELVRNAYDADATLCTINIQEVASTAPTITVTDNGEGMDLQAITQGWLVLGASGKSQDRRTQKFARWKVGDKGLGRLAALRAGNVAKLVTRRADADRALAVTLDWSRFDAATVVEDVPLTIDEGAAATPVGTAITLEHIRRPLSIDDYDRLARNLILLNSPFEGTNNFRIELKSPRFPQFEKRVADSYLTEAEFRLVAELHDDGTADATVYDWKGAILYRAAATEWLSKKREPAESTYTAPKATFELYAYVLSAEAFSQRQVNVTDVRNWLKIVGGVHIYHQRFRVPPYGDPGHDWLDMNLARARSPEERPSTNNSVGRLIVEDTGQQLVQKTDRFGFIESPVFLELKRFAMEALQWFTRERLREAERRRGARRQRTSKEVLDARGLLEALLEKHVPARQRKAALEALKAYQRAHERVNAENEKELMLYRALATAGSTATVFAHEVNKPITIVNNTLENVRTKLSAMRPKRIFEAVENALTRMSKATARLESFSAMQLDLLRREKRRSGSVDVLRTLRNLRELWTPVLKGSGITLELDAPHHESIAILGSEALLETVVTNCLTNITRAFEQQNAKLRHRRAVIRCSATDEHAVLEIEDNGPGISLPFDDIWLPGRSGYDTGTGFGLTIVRDSVRDLTGTFAAESPGTLGGALFTFTFPRLRQ